jgi:[ribosomal protein S5]-alanine N-acetyltransferase
MLARIRHLDLVEIGADGTPAQAPGALSEFATAACAQTAAHYKKAGFSPPWISFLATCDSQVVGICAFTAAPTGGRVEIAYHTFPPFEGRGAATAMVRELIIRAQRSDPHVELFAHTLAEQNASNTVLRKLGFEFVGQHRHPEEGEIWEWRHRSI